ncbi:methionyl-tRNA formyltransferase [Acidocella sp.]|uniref:methionyl-tRNA formyltransferase n=1 Tax=Acidocella sp. TaxID=50710 RepID=UPI0026283A6D|nr:methionyl-tRNA formyltransferase [Acidocella sp.]
MRLAFMGSPDFSVPALNALVAAGHEVAVVYAQPPKPAGRGQKEQKCPVHQAAEALGLAVRTPRRLRGNEEELAFFKSLALDGAVVAAYGLILPQGFLDAPKRGCLNIHASLLPRWRGAAPIQAAIAAGDAETGVTIMQMEAGLDTGPMLRKGQMTIGPRDTASTLHDALSAMGAALMIEELAHPSAPERQDDALATHVGKLTREDARLDFTLPARVLERRIRAYTPWPGATACYGEVVLKILAAEMAEGHGAPGTVLDDRLSIACGEGALRVTRLQRPGKGPMAAAEFLRGLAISKGARLS